MPLSFTTALSGLRANSDALSNTGNNIANAKTTAFKSSTTSFADVYTNNVGGTPVQIGSGVRTVATPTNFSQGALSDTGTATNAAIQGNGFFVLRDSAGIQTYTRAGDFTLDREGYLVTPGGQRVQGYAESGTPGGTSPLTALRVPIGVTIEPRITTEASLRMNLNSTDPTGAAFHAPVQVYDSRGVSHTLDMTFTKQSDGSYDVTATLDDNPVTSPASTNVTFDSNGQLVAPNSINVVPDQTLLNGATLPSITVRLREMNLDSTPGASLVTNYAAPTAVSSSTQDGFGAGSLTGASFSLQRDGMLFAVFSNGQTRPLGQLALATFNSQEGLRKLGNNQYGETLASGQPSIGVASAGGRGDIIGGSLEGSNVDLATEFTEMIIAQRGFSANSRVITTINQTLQDLLQAL